MIKEIEWRGSSLNDLREFPADARKNAGFKLEQAQQGLQPNGWKPINDWGSGVIEIKLEASAGTFRVVYVAKFEGVLYVLHCFQKKDQRTLQKDVDIIKTRYAGVLWERRRK